MPYNQNKKKYNMEYAKENLKRIPLDVQREKYDQIKEAADLCGETVNGFIKTAIDTRLAGLNLSKGDLSS